MTDPRVEIAESLFECRAEIRYVLAHQLTSKVLTVSQREQLEILVEQMEGVGSALDALVAV
ncbi:hypothetical protein AB3R30_25495 [Leptolyngbyaceae cyanobacterium UHCC 1019]